MLSPARILACQLVLTALATAAPQMDVGQSPPSFATGSKKFRVVTEDTVILPCEIYNLGDYQVVWKRGANILTAGPHKIYPDKRISLVNSTNLKIKDITTKDAGDYVCQISLLEPITLTHTLEILVPPRIQKVSNNGGLEVKKGSTVTLECKASGNPVPIITWSRKNNLLPSGEKSVEGFSITIEQANRHQAGVYQCMASNGVGQPVLRDITLRVQYAPEIEVERNWVHSGEGFEAQLVCIVHAEPPAEVLWFRDTLRLDTTERMYAESRGSRHTLFIRKVDASDFGNYSCAADNALGKSRQFLELSGRPNRAIFLSNPHGRFRDTYNISFSVDSYTPVEEYKLYFRKLPDNDSLLFGNHLGHGGSERGNNHHGIPIIGGYRGAMGTNEWRDVIINVDRNDKSTRRVHYMIHGLEPGTEYEAKVQARNRFGWNNVSTGFRFDTRGSEPEVRDLGMTAAAGGGSSIRVSAGQSGLFLAFTLFMFLTVVGAASCGCVAS
ncbi:neural cell adhesion molecule 2 isoform X2 [Neocloeon triangulifer]|uniref:neural cell adhesion molecule 2 isoform X2 n=1 Tax=Neocloeon triangulifer TaxID=2078957 RepID=UPI00286EC9BE|nr:neural cell adhesion molecule 2 isoform X2 [Neocloeon triangulifer]